jgi:hypothetical protein
MANAEPMQSITFAVRDTGGQAYDVLLRVAEQTASGSLAFTPAAGVTEQYPLTQIQKSRDGKTLTCHTGMATATLTVEDGHTPPLLHLVVRVFFPVVDTAYTLSQAEQHRLVAWLNALRLPELS